MNGIAKVKKLKSIIDEEHHNLIILKDNFEVINFILNEPEKIENNMELLYGMKSLIKSFTLDIENIYNQLDIPIDLWEIEQ